MGNKSGKVWGKTEEIVKTPFCELHRAEIKKGGNCSIHHHKFKINGFFVESGSLIIKQFMENGIIDETTLGKGDYMECLPNIEHMFRALEDCVVFEIYYPVVIGEDIQRKTQGFMEDV